MPKGTREKGRVQTGQVNFGSMGTSSESDVINSKGKVVSGNPEGNMARNIIGDKGIARHKRSVKEDARRLKGSEEGSYTKTISSGGDDFSEAVEMVKKKKTTNRSAY